MLGLEGCFNYMVFERCTGFGTSFQYISCIIGPGQHQGQRAVARMPPPARLSALTLSPNPEPRPQTRSSVLRLSLIGFSDLTKGSAVPSS